MRILNVDLVVCDRCGSRVEVRIGTEHKLNSYSTLTLRNNVFEPVAISAIRHGKELSSREAEVMELLAKGSSNKVIARQLKMMEATVKVHVKSILRKTGTNNRTQAAMISNSIKEEKEIPVMTTPIPSGPEIIGTPVALVADLCLNCVKELREFLGMPNNNGNGQEVKK